MCAHIIIVGHNVTVIVSIYANFACTRSVNCNSWLQRDHCYIKYQIEKHPCFNETLNPSCDLDREYSNPKLFTRHSSLWWCTITLSLAARGSAVRKIQQKWSCFVYLRPHFDLKLEDSNLFVRHSSSWWCINTPSSATKGSTIQKISSGQTLTNILNICCDLHLEHSKPIFS